MELKDFIAGCSALFSIGIGVFTFSRAKKQSETAMAVERALLNQRMDQMDKRINEIAAELGGVKSGLEFGIGEVQKSINALGEMPVEMKISVAVLTDRDERDPRAPTPRRPRASRAGGRA